MLHNNGYCGTRFEKIGCRIWFASPQRSTTKHENSYNIASRSVPTMRSCWITLVCCIKHSVTCNSPVVTLTGRVRSIRPLSRPKLIERNWVSSRVNVSIDIVGLCRSRFFSCEPRTFLLWRERLLRASFLQSLLVFNFQQGKYSYRFFLALPNLEISGAISHS